MSNNKLHVKGLPSFEEQNEPSSLRLKKEIKRRLMSEASLTDLVVEQEDDAIDLESDTLFTTDASTAISPRADAAGLRIKRNTMELLADAIKQIDANELVEVLGPFGRITFRAMHISSNDYGIAFIVSKDHMTYEPNVNTNLILKFGDQTHSVVYAGGYFTFRQMPFTFLSFIKITE